MIYLFGSPVTIARVATEADIKTLECRKPDKQDREALKLGSYWVVRFEDGYEKLAHLAYLRADGAAKEVDEACEAAREQKTGER